MKWFKLFIDIAFIVCVDLIIFDYGQVTHHHILWTIVFMLALTTALGTKAWEDFQEHNFLNMIAKLEEMKENEDGTRN